jgi:hypothetical protein
MMTKLTRIAITVPTDDDVLADAVHAALRKHLEALPMERVGGPDGGRIHWPAADVKRLVERAPQAAKPKAAISRKSATPQGDAAP